MIYNLTITIEDKDDDRLGRTIEALDNRKIQYALEAVDFEYYDEYDNLIESQELELTVVKKADSVEYLEKYAGIVLGLGDYAVMHREEYPDGNIYIDAVG